MTSPCSERSSSYSLNATCVVWALENWLLGICLPGVWLFGVCLLGVCLLGICLLGVGLLGIFLLGICLLGICLLLPGSVGGLSNDGICWLRYYAAHWICKIADFVRSRQEPAVTLWDFKDLTEYTQRSPPSIRLMRTKLCSTRSSRSRRQGYTDAVGGQTTKGNGGYSRKSAAIVCQPGLDLNSLGETPGHRHTEGRPVCSGGPDHPKAVHRSSTTVTKTPEAVVWLIASSAAQHMTGNVNQLTDYKPAPDDLVVQVPNMGPMRAHGTGSVRTATMSLHNVLHVPGLDKNLVSTSQLAKLGYTITLGPSGCRVTKDEIVVGEAHFTHEYLFQIDFIRVPA